MRYVMYVTYFDVRGVDICALRDVHDADVCTWNVCVMLVQCVCDAHNVCARH